MKKLKDEDAKLELIQRIIEKGLSFGIIETTRRESRYVYETHSGETVVVHIVATDVNDVLKYFDPVCWNYQFVGLLKRHLYNFY